MLPQLLHTSANVSSAFSLAGLGAMQQFKTGVRLRCPALSRTDWRSNLAGISAIARGGVGYKPPQRRHEPCIFVHSFDQFSRLPYCICLVAVALRPANVACITAALLAWGDSCLPSVGTHAFMHAGGPSSTRISSTLFKVQSNATVSLMSSKISM